MPGKRGGNVVKPTAGNIFLTATLPNLRAIFPDNGSLRDALFSCHFSASLADYYRCLGMVIRDEGGLAVARLPGFPAIISSGRRGRRTGGRPLAYGNR